MTDTRARALLVPIVTHGCECGREMCATHKGIAQALADERRQALESIEGRLAMMEKYLNSARYAETLDLVVNTREAFRQAQAGPEEGA